MTYHSAALLKPTRGAERTDEAAPGDPPLPLVALVLGACVASRFLAVAASPGEIDEAIFSGAVLRFDMAELSPQAPGFPVWILLGRLLHAFVPYPFAALALASTLLAALALPALYVWGRSVVGGWAALSGVLLSASLPVIWVYGGRAFSDTPGTAFFLLALAALTRVESTEPARGARYPGVSWMSFLAGLLAAAGAGVRPHLVMIFGLPLLLSAIRLGRSGRGREVAALVGAGLLGTGLWVAWLLDQAGGPAAFVDALRERAGFRAQAFATGSFGRFTDSFVVRDFLSPRRALLVHAFAAAGALALLLGLRRRGRGRRIPVLSLLLVLGLSFLSLWFLHSRAMSRYSVPYVHALALLFGAGAVWVLRRPPLGFLATAALAGLFARDAWPEVRWGARNETPPMEAIAVLERYVHPGRETIVADPPLAAFLRFERWDGRLVAWGYLDSDWVAQRQQANKRLVRLRDFTADVDAADRRDPAWRTFFHGGRVADMLGNGRLLAVGLRDPGPPLFGPGFGAREEPKGKRSFRWGGREAILTLPSLSGPPAALLLGERLGDDWPSTLWVREIPSGRTVWRRELPPGIFEMAIVPSPVAGPLPAAATFAVGCEEPRPLPPVTGSVRPPEGCAAFFENAVSRPSDSLWEARDGRYSIDLGAPGDAWVDPTGFHARERLADPPLDMRWTSAVASVLWVPQLDFRPRRLRLVARPPVADPVTVTVTVGELPAGSVTVPPGPFGEVVLELPEPAAGALSGADVVRISLACSATWSPKRAGKGDDARELGIGIDRVGLE